MKIHHYFLYVFIAVGLCLSDSSFAVTATGATPSASSGGTARAMGVAGAAAGAAGIYASTTGQGQHGIGNVAAGTASGALGGAAFGVWGIVGGAVIGGAISGSQLLSETDCLQDPVTGKFTCCNTVFNKGERQAKIGEYMFCADKDNKLIQAGVRQCLQGGKDKEAGWWDGMWQDDAWSKECKLRMCAGQKIPDKGTPSDSIDWKPNTSLICWSWGCKNGYTKKGNTCVSNSARPDGTSSQVETESYDKLIQKIQQQIQQIQQECNEIM